MLLVSSTQQEDYFQTAWWYSFIHSKGRYALNRLPDTSSPSHRDNSQSPGDGRIVFGLREEAGGKPYMIRRTCKRHKRTQPGIKSRSSHCTWGESASHYTWGVQGQPMVPSLKDNQVMEKVLITVCLCVSDVQLNHISTFSTMKLNIIKRITSERSRPEGDLSVREWSEIGLTFKDVFCESDGKITWILALNFRMSWSK